MRSGLASTTTLGHRPNTDGLHCTERGGSTGGVIAAQQASEDRCAGVVVVGVLVTFSGEPELQRKQAPPGTWRGDVTGAHHGAGPNLVLHAGKAARVK